MNGYLYYFSSEVTSAVTYIIHCNVVTMSPRKLSRKKLRHKLDFNCRCVCQLNFLLMFLKYLPVTVPSYKPVWMFPILLHKITLKIKVASVSMFCFTKKLLC